MITFQSNAKNDLVLNMAGNLQTINGLDAIAQTARQYMQTRRLEMFLATNRGMPFDPVAWSGDPNVAQFEAAGRARLLEVPDVVEVVSFQARLDGDTLNYVATLRTTLGVLVING